MKKTYIEFSNTAEKYLKTIITVPSPAKCTLYRSVKAEIIDVKVCADLPLITFTFRPFDSKLAQTVLYTNSCEAIFAIDDAEVKDAVDTWQQELDKAFQGTTEPVVIPDVEEVPDLKDCIDPLDLEGIQTDSAVEMLDNTKGLIEDESFSESSVEEPAFETGFEAFLIWAVENLRTLSEDKASFKKDIPEEFSSWASTKRTTTNKSVLNELTARASAAE